MNSDNLLRVNIREFRANLKEYLTGSIKESIIITKNNNDFVLIEFIGDMEDFEDERT